MHQLRNPVQMEILKVLAPGHPEMEEQFLPVPVAMAVAARDGQEMVQLPTIRVVELHQQQPLRLRTEQPEVRPMGLMAAMAGLVVEVLLELSAVHLVQVVAVDTQVAAQELAMELTAAEEVAEVITHLQLLSYRRPPQIRALDTSALLL
jgi:hypothetical protein